MLFAGSEYLCSIKGVQTCAGVRNIVIRVSVSRRVMTYIQEHDFASGRFSVFQVGLVNLALDGTIFFHERGRHVGGVPRSS